MEQEISLLLLQLSVLRGNYRRGVSDMDYRFRALRAVKAAVVVGSRADDVMAVIGQRALSAMKYSAIEC